LQTRVIKSPQIWYFVFKKSSADVGDVSVQHIEVCQAPSAFLYGGQQCKFLFTILFATAVKEFNICLYNCRILPTNMLQD